MNSNESLKPYNVGLKQEGTLRNQVEAALEKIVAGVPVQDLNLSGEVRREIDRLIRIAKMQHGVSTARRPKLKAKRPSK